MGMGWERAGLGRGESAREGWTTDTARSSECKCKKCKWLIKTKTQKTGKVAEEEKENTDVRRADGNI